MAVSDRVHEREIGSTAPRSAGRALDWLNLFVANIQTGFGPFITVYLTTQRWTQTAIGFALSLGTVTAMASQVPAEFLGIAHEYGRIATGQRANLVLTDDELNVRETWIDGKDSRATTQPSRSSGT